MASRKRNAQVRPAGLSGDAAEWGESMSADFSADVAALCDGTTTMRAFALHVLDGCEDGDVNGANDWLDAVASRCGQSDVLENVREDFIAESDAESAAAYLAGTTLRGYHGSLSPATIERMERAARGTEPNRSR